MKYVLRSYCVVQLQALNTDYSKLLINFYGGNSYHRCTVRIHGKSRSEAILIPVAFITTSNFPWPLLPCTAGGNIIFRGSCYHRRWQYHFLFSGVAKVGQGGAHAPPT